MPTLQLDNTYYSKSTETYQWLKYYAPDTAWDQTFGTTTLIFTTQEKLDAFVEWINKL